MTRLKAKERPVPPHWPHYQSARASDKRIYGPCALCAEEKRGRCRTGYGLVCECCYRNALTSAVCSQCHLRKVRAKPDDANPCCGVCRHRRLVAASACARCGEALIRVEQWTREGPICPTCYHRSRPAKLCGYCDEQRRSVRMRSKYGNGRPICHSCVQKRLPKCHECGLRFRPSTGLLDATVCPKCLSDIREKVQCACGAWTRQSDLTPARCDSCAAKPEGVPRTRERLLNGLSQPWVKDLFTEYCDSLCLLSRTTGPVPSMLRTDLDIFVGIDRAFSASSQLNECSLASALGPPLFRRRTRLLRWMVKRSLIGPLSSLDREWALLPWKVRALTDNRTPTWIVEAIEAFQQDIICERDRFVRKNHKRTCVPLQARSALMNLRAARSFLVTVQTWGLEEVTAIQQVHIDRYAAAHRRPLLELGRFIRFLNQRTVRFRSISPPWQRRTRGLAHTMTSVQFDDLIACMLQPKTHVELKYMLMTLFCLLFAQYPKTTVSLRLDQLRETAGQWEFRPAKVWLSVPEPMGKLLTRWQASRREQSVMDPTGSSHFLFPGLRASTCASTASFASWLSERGTRSSQLFVSGFWNLCRHGLEFASVARNAYGVNPSTAVRYLAEFHPAKARVAAREVRASTVRSKRRHSR